MIDRGRAADVMAAVGRERYQALVERLRDEVVAIDADAGLLPTLHRLRGSSATLGLDGVAAGLMAVEAMIGLATRAEVLAAVAALDLLIPAAFDDHDGGGAT